LNDGQLTDQATAVPPVAPATAARPRVPALLHIGIIAAILGAGILATTLTSDVSRVSEPGVRLVDGKPYLPEQAGDWIGGPLQGLTEDERKLLPPDTEGARRLYKDKEGRELFCSVVLAGTEVTSIHRPELCLPGQGWRIEQEYTEPVPTDDAPGGVLRVMRMNATRTFPLVDGRTVQTRSIFAYWFVGKNRVTPHHWERILWTSKDRVLHNRNHRWAYVLIHVPLMVEQLRYGSARTDEEAIQMINSFVREIYPELVAG